MSYKETLLLGNGFDLYHYLFTGYKEFINVCDFLIHNNQYDIENLTVYNILFDTFKGDKDKLNKLLYYEDAYKATHISGEHFNNLTTLLSKNCWFHYLSEQCKSEQWVSLEKTISELLNSITTNNTNFLYDFFEPLCKISYNNYTKKYIFDSWINSERGTMEIYNDFKDLILSLKLYLKNFVDKVFDNIPKFDSSLNLHFRAVENVISFNYTHTYEKLYDSDVKVIHIHGSTDNEIVVGINPDQNDIKGNTNPKYIAFKKYYQRIVKNTINELSILFYTNKKSKSRHLLKCIGHSLDVTDSDIITTVFDLFDNIIIYYHDESSLDKYIKNLTQIYGADDFNKMLLSLKIVFKKLPSNEYKL